MSGPFELDMERASGCVEVGVTTQGSIVIFKDDRLTKAKMLTVKLRRVVHGSGNKEVWEREVFALSAEALIAGEYKFLVPIPETGPCSHDGRYVKISWELVASLDIPWAIDPSSTLHFTVKPRGSLQPQVRITFQKSQSAS